MPDPWTKAAGGAGLATATPQRNCRKEHPMPENHVDVKYKAQPIEDAKGHLKALRVHRQEFRAPKTRSGVSWSRGEYINGPWFEVPVMEVSELIRELVSWLEYFASDHAAEDRA